MFTFKLTYSCKMCEDTITVSSNNTKDICHKCDYNVKTTLTYDGILKEIYNA